MKFHQHRGQSVDPDETYWGEMGNSKHRGIYFINVVRVFYEIGPSELEQLCKYNNFVFAVNCW